MGWEWGGNGEGTSRERGESGQGMDRGWGGNGMGMGMEPAWSGQVKGWERKRQVQGCQCRWS